MGGGLRLGVMDVGRGRTRLAWGRLKADNILETDAIKQAGFHQTGG